MHNELAITSGSLADGVMGRTYSAVLAATGGNGRYAWSIRAAKLPNGLRLSSKGIISGRPIKQGSFTFTVKVTGGVLSTSRAFTLTVKPRTQMK